MQKSTRFVTGLGAGVKPYFCSVAILYLQLTTLTLSKKLLTKQITAARFNSKVFQTLKRLSMTARFIKGD